MILYIIEQEITIQPESTSKEWKIFPSTNIPPLFNEGHIYHYLVDEVNSIHLVGDPDSESEDDDVDTEKPLQKGRALCNSGFVTDIQDCCDTACYHVRC